MVGISRCLALNSIIKIDIIFFKLIQGNESGDSLENRRVEAVIRARVFPHHDSILPPILSYPTPLRGPSQQVALL